MYENGACQRWHAPFFMGLRGHLEVRVYPDGNGERRVEIGEQARPFRG